MFKKGFSAFTGFDLSATGEDGKMHPTGETYHVSVPSQALISLLPPPFLTKTCKNCRQATILAIFTPFLSHSGLSLIHISEPTRPY